MTGREFYRWLLNHGCTQELMNDNTTTGHAIEISNPANGKYYFLQTPIGDNELFPKTVTDACVQLGIEIPPARMLQ